MSTKPDSWSESVFRKLLRLFPMEFRGDYGREMEGVFREQRRELNGRGGLLRLWWETLLGVVRTAPREHWEMLRQDAGFALRTLRKDMRYTVLAVLILGLGIGANTAIFSVVRGVLLRPLPYQDGERIVLLRQRAPLAEVQDMRFSVPEIQDYRQSRTLEDVVEYHNMPFILLGKGEPERVQTGVVSARFFDVLKVEPVLGRKFLPGDEREGAPSVLLLSYAYWKRAHGGDPGVLGHTVEMNGRMHTVVGVLPPLPQFPDENDVYMPTTSCPFRSRPMMITGRTMRMMRAFGKLKPGVAPEEAQAELSTLADGVERSYPEAYPANRGYGISSALLQEELTRGARPMLLVLLATAGLVLLIACANVANLTLSRQMRRGRELAVRAALGARQARLFRQLLTESSLLALTGGVLGLALAYALLDVLVSFVGRFTLRAGEVTMDGTVLLFALGVSLLSGVLFGSLPALPGRKELLPVLGESSSRTSAGGGRHGLRAALVVGQVAVSLMLLAAAGLMVRTMIKLQSVDAGFNADNVLTLLVDLNWSKYNAQEPIVRFHDDVLLRASAHPGVISAAFSRTYPLNEGARTNVPLLIEGKPLEPDQPQPVFDFISASPEYFRTLGISLLRGRVFDERDRDGQPGVAVVSQSFARRHFGDDDPVGRRISGDNGQSWDTIVGVVSDVKQYGLDRDAAEAVYYPIAQAPNRVATLMVRTGSDPEAMAREIVNLVYAVDPQQPVAEVQTLAQVRDDSLAGTRVTTALLALFAALALVITTAGIGGVVALSVSQRTSEIGIRMALGALPRNILAMVVREGLTLVLAGLALGAVGAALLTRAMSGLLFGVTPTDPLTYAAVAVVFLAAALGACVLPARRATAVEPVIALRHS